MRAGNWVVVVLFGGVLMREQTVPQTVTYRDGFPMPLTRRTLDIIFLAFFLLNLLFITYVVDLEQLIIPDASHFTYPAWPPPAAVDMIHSYGKQFDPLLIARPVWWKMTILLDAVFFGPFYIAAIVAFVRGRNWIRIPCFLYSGMIFANVAIILGEERFGPYLAPNFGLVLLLNLPWLLIPILLTMRMLGSETPFTATEPQSARYVQQGAQIAR
jgi:EXPERA (EXPanded EBP superfamily)